MDTAAKVTTLDVGFVLALTASNAAAAALCHELGVKPEHREWVISSLSWGLVLGTRPRHLGARKPRDRKVQDRIFGAIRRLRDALVADWPECEAWYQAELHRRAVVATFRQFGFVAVHLPDGSWTVRDPRGIGPDEGSFADEAAALSFLATGEAA
jgi:hypothetical protein